MDTIRAAALGLEEDACLQVRQAGRERRDRRLDDPNTHRGGLLPADGRTLLGAGAARRAQAEAVRQAGEVITSFGTMEAEVFVLVWKGDTGGDWVARMSVSSMSSIGNLSGLGGFAILNELPAQSALDHRPIRTTIRAPTIKLSLHQLSNSPYRQVARFVL
jgi:hypothetical protein